MSAKQILLVHIRLEHRRQPSARLTLAELQYWHRNEHHRYFCNHYHEGSNTGPGDRPVGWYTGEGAVPNNVR